MPSVKGISSLQEQYKLALIKMANGNLAKVVYAGDWKSLDNGSTPLVSTAYNAPLVEFGRHSGFRLQCEVIVV